MCADTEQELNKWVTGIRVAKYGKQLFTNYRGIVEEMAHDDLDQLASSRFSADPITLAVAAAQVNNSDEPELEFSGSSRAMKVPSRAELGHFNFRAETELNRKFFNSFFPQIFIIKGPAS